MRATLGGSVTTRDVLKYDYCIEECLESIIPVCDEVVVLDCGSTDGTLELLRSLAARHGNLRVIGNQDWECAPDHERLSILANRARDHLHTNMRLMMDADEVLHEASFPAIREMLEADGWGHLAFKVRRLNLYGDFAHHVGYGCPHPPCDNEPTRLGRLELEAFQGAESLRNPTGGSLVDRVWIFHYGFVRRPDVMVDKVIDMQRWFSGPHGTPDARVVAMKDRGVAFQPHEIMAPGDLSPMEMRHPAVAHDWVRARGGKP